LHFFQQLVYCIGADLTNSAISVTRTFVASQNAIDQSIMRSLRPGVEPQKGP